MTRTKQPVNTITHKKKQKKKQRLTTHSKFPAHSTNSSHQCTQGIIAEFQQSNADRKALQMLQYLRKASFQHCSTLTQKKKNLYDQI